MSENAQVALISMIGTTLAAVLALVGTFIVAYFNLRKLQIENSDKIDEVKVAQEATHKEINSRMTQLIETTAASEKAKGNLEGRQELKIEQTPKGFGP